MSVHGILNHDHQRSVAAIAGIALAWLSAPGAAVAQDLEPRRWTHMPVGTNVAGLTYHYAEGDIAFDPVLELTDVTVEAHTVYASYSRSLDVFGKTGRIDAIVPYESASWEGFVSGSPASRERTGFADPWLRLSVDLAGAPALKGEEYRRYRAANPINTVVGAALAVRFPLGDYQSDKLLNLGQNRFVIRPQAGFVHTRGPWSYELTGSVFFFTANDDFFGGSERTQDPLFAFQAHAIHTFQNRYWASVSAGYSWGGESQIDGVSKDDTRATLLSAISAGMPLGKTQGLKVVYLRGDAQRDVGSDTNNLLLSWNVRF